VRFINEQLHRFWWVALCAALLVAPVVVTADEAEAEAERPEIAGTDQCVACHFDDESMPEGWLVSDIHLQVGLSCAGCHGGDPTSDDEDEAMSEAAGFIGAPSKKEIPDVCGRCHSDISLMREYQPRIATDQVAQYLTSMHGRKLLEGDSKVADCTSCHTAHAIMPANDGRSTVYALNVPKTCDRCHGDADYMAPYGISTTQYVDYAEGVHGKALLEARDTGAPACNDCHGNHGAMPPGISSVTHVCGNCHVNNLKYFEGTRMAEAFAEEDLHGCEECHGNHAVLKTSDLMVGTTDQSVCMDCHESGDHGYMAADTISMQLASLVAAYDSATVMQHEIHRIGMDDEEMGFVLLESHQNLIQARTLVHTFDPRLVGPETDLGLAKAREAMVMAAQLEHESMTRRRGFGMATIFITVLVIALVFKIRELDAKLPQR
jgi:hypothetical protein